MRTRRWLLLLPVAAFLIILPVLAERNDPLQPANGTGIFIDTGQEIGFSTSNDVALGDLDGDGDLDAFVVNGSGSGEANKVWFNQALTFVPSEQDLGDAYSRGVALGDMDRDGDLDAFVANEGPNEVWVNQGGDQQGTEGIFLDSGQALGSAEGRAVAVDDLDGDGDLDAAVANSSLDNERIWWNDGSGGFSPGPTLGERHALDVAIGNLNDDSQPDVVFVEGGLGRDNQIYWNDWITNSTFVAGPTFDAGALVDGVALDDLDDNGTLDVALATRGANAIWWNNGDETLSPGAAPGTTIDTDIALGDLDGDDAIDAFVTTLGANVVWFNNGDQTFGDSGQTLGNGTSFAVALGDLDGDLDLDAFVANSGPNKVWLNGGTVEPLPAAQFHFVDSGQYIGPTDSESAALGDLDGDGDLDAFLGGDEENEVWLNQGGLQGGQLGHFQDSGQQFGLGNASDVALGDLDGDGDLDAFVVNGGLDSQVWLNNGAAVFSESLENIGLFDGHAVALGDLDKDGDLDAVISRILDPHRVYVNQGGADFDSTTQLLGDGNGNGDDVALADLNGDGYLDIFIAQGPDFYDSQVWLSKGGTPVPEFTRSQQALPRSEAVILAHLNSDAHLDAFIGSTVLFGNGDGSFTESGQELAEHHEHAALGDLDGDGDLDGFTADTLDPERVWANTGAGIFVDGGVRLGPDHDDNEQVRLGDVDSDGDLDVLVVNDGDPNRLWFNYSCAVELVSLPEETTTTLSNVMDKTYTTLRAVAVDLDLFYRVRDELLPQTGSGRRYTRLYYTHNPEILTLLIADDALRAEARSVLELWQPNLGALLDGQGDTATITADQVQAVEDFLQDLSAAGSDRLQEAIALELRLLPPPGDFVGLTMEEAAEIVLHDNIIYLPSILKSE